MIEDATRSGRAARVGLTFLGLFLGLNGVCMLMLAIPVVSEPIGAVWLAFWAALMPTLGEMLEIEGPISTMPAGSSDMTWNYVQLLCYVVVAALATVGVSWRSVDARDVALAGWLRIVVRYALAMAMFEYGLIKVIPVQFEALGPVHLARTYGESSPAGLLWSFMGFSRVYAGFTGLAEMLAAALLLSRRTATLGALMAVAVMTNVVIMNFCFDVPVKLFSSLLLLMAVYVALPDIRRVVDVLVRSRPAEPRDLRAPVLGRRLRVARLMAKGGFVVAVAWIAGELLLTYMSPARERPQLYGAWEVEHFMLAGEGGPASATEDVRWRQFAVPGYPVAVVRRARGEPLLFALAHDVAAGTIVLTAIDETQTVLTLAVERPASDLLVLSGPIGAGTAEIRLHRIDTEHAPLMTRGFHWVSEAPYNR